MSIFNRLIEEHNVAISEMKALQNGALKILNWNWNWKETRTRACMCFLPISMARTVEENINLKNLNSVFRSFS